MEKSAADHGLIFQLFPFFSWLKNLGLSTTRTDLEAGLVGAILILPQAIALASLAGMPPEFGIYTSIFPVIIASLWGSSWHTLSGPNTAVCVMIAASVAPLASVGSDIFIGYVLLLSLMVGLIQLGLGLLRLGNVLDFISQTVISAIVLAVALIIIVSAAASFLGVQGNASDPFLIRLYHLVHDLGNANGYSVIVGGFTVLTGFLMRRWWKRYSLIIAVIAGSLLSAIINLAVGPATSNLSLVGNLDLGLLPFSSPEFEIDSGYLFKELFSAALAIAFLGLMQTIVISRSISSKSGQAIDTNQEIIGQGLSNMAAPFLSSFAGSGSFNRSAAHYESGARTPMAAVYASLLLLIAVLAGSTLIAYIPSAAIAGALILVGYGLIDQKEVKTTFLSKQETMIFIVTFLSSLIFDLNTGVFAGFIFSLIVYLWYASTPNVALEKTTARDGRPVFTVIIDGNLFFGSLRHVERSLRNLDSEGDTAIILIRTDHLTYLDIPGAEMIGEEVRRRRSSGDDVFLYVTRKSIGERLQQSRCIEILGEDHLIYKDFDHEMKKLLYPQTKDSFFDSNRKNLYSPMKEEAMSEDEILVSHLRSVSLLAPLSREQLEDLVNDSHIEQVKAGDFIRPDSRPLEDHLILLEGSLEIEREAHSEQGGHKGFTSTLVPTHKGFAFLGAANGITAKAIEDSRYIILNADHIDALVGWNQTLGDEFLKDPTLKHRFHLIRNISLFHQIPFENIKQTFNRMQERLVDAGETVIEQGDIGDSFYLIESGSCEVIQTDPFTEETSVINHLSAGDAFGEEALIQESSRSATVKMTTPGKLLVLEKNDFDQLLRTEMVSEIEPEEALGLVKDGNAQWLDCRYDMEYEESRIPGAPLLPLNDIRHQLYKLNQDKPYIVYCRSGRRSKAASYLLRERGFEAKSLKGGIRDWPYEIDDEWLDLEG